MKPNYEIIKTKSGEYPAIVFSVSHISPLDQFEDIEKDLLDGGVSGKVLLDLLLSHGNTPDRFCEVSFNGKGFSEKALKTAAPLSKKLMDITLNFYHDHQHLLERSVLSRAQRFLIKKRLHLKMIRA